MCLSVIEKEMPDIKRQRSELPKGKERIMVVDDEKSTADVMRKLLERLGYDVKRLLSSVDALETFRNNPDVFDLVLTDMTMPGLSGDALARKIMAVRSDTPVILCTGFNDKIDEKKAKEFGISAFIMKPVTLSDMAKTIREVLDKCE